MQTHLIENIVNEIKFSIKFPKNHTFAVRIV